MSDISQQTFKLKELIEKSNRILITSHISPDPDSICSTLLLGTTLKENYPNKQIVMHGEEHPEGLDFLPSYEDIDFCPLLGLINERFDLIIIVDAMNFARCSRSDHGAISRLLEEQNIPVAIIDHHQPLEIQENQVYINQDYPAAVEEVYDVCFKHLNFKKPSNWAEITMVGLYADTAGFTFLRRNFQDTLDLLSELLKSGQDIELTKDKLNQYSKEDVETLSLILKNVSVEGDYTFSYLNDDYVTSWINSGKTPASLHVGLDIFSERFVRNIGGNKWGFIVYKYPLFGDDFYSVSLRAVNGVKDVSAIARKMSGGGHKGAAGAKIQAGSVEEAIEKIKKVIAESGL
jgi:phosphoesterase RecJ-like protein